MTANIQTIFFDVGNTLRIVLPDQEFIDRAEAGLMELIGTTESHDALFAKLEERWKAYRKQSKTPCWMLPRENCGPSTCCRNMIRI